MSKRIIRSGSKRRQIAPGIWQWQILCPDCNTAFWDKDTNKITINNCPKCGAAPYSLDSEIVPAWILNDR